MHSPIEAGLALNGDLAHKRAALAANMHRALLTAALAHVQHPLQRTAADQLRKLSILYTFQQSISCLDAAPGALR